MNGKSLSAGLIPLCAMSLLFTIAVYPALPDRFPIHWNLHGIPNGWGDKQWAAFLLPGMIAVLLLTFQIVSQIRRDDASEDMEVRNYILNLVGWMFALMQAFSIRIALYPDQHDAPLLLTSGLLIMVAALSNVLGKVSRNRFIGIRTPWTLDNDIIWRATHRLAARLMTLVGALGAVVVWLGVPPRLCWIAFLASALIPAAYSYLLYMRYTDSGEK